MHGRNRHGREFVPSPPIATCFFAPLRYTQGKGEEWTPLVVYVDAVFVLNGLINWMLLRAAARVRGCAVSRWRLAVGALVGGGYAVGCYLPGLTWLQRADMKLAALALMLMAAFGARRQTLGAGAVFLLLSVGLCGAVYGVLTLVLHVPVTAGGFYPVTFPELLLTCCLSAGAVGLILRRCALRPGERVVPLVVRMGGQTVRLSAFHDTGNSLTDPVSGEPVLVAEAAALTQVLGKQAVRAVQQGNLEAAMRQLSAYQPRLIPYRTVGTSGGLLVAVRCETAELHSKSSRRALIALSPTPVSDRGDYHALMGGTG